MSSFQSPQLLTDLYRDLRDRRLLALAVVLVVGIAIVPIALASSSKTPEPKFSGTAGPVARKSPAAALDVVAADPGLRAYRRRLKGDPATDPFKQRYTAPSGLAAAQLGQTSATTGGDSGAVSPASSSVTTPPSTTGTSVPSGAPISQPVSKTSTKTKYVVYRIDVQTGPADGALQERDNVGTFTALPSETAPALAFIGISKDVSTSAKTAYFLISSSVTSMSGDGVCALGGDQCQLLALGRSQHEDFLWSDGVTYRIDLVGFNRILRNKLPSLGRKNRPQASKPRSSRN